MRRFVLAFAVACLLTSCGGSGTFSPTVEGACVPSSIAAQLLGKTWIGLLDCGGTTRMLRVTFAENNCHITVNGVALIYNGTTFPSFPGTGVGGFDNNTGAFIPMDAPVTINGSQATFTMSFIVFNPTNNRTTIPPGPILVVPGTTFPVTISVNVADNSLSGSYSTTQADNAHQQGDICFSPETVPTANVAGHWTGVMSGTTDESVGPGTLDTTLAMNGNAVDLGADGTMTTSEVTVSLTSPTGISGMVIGNQVLIGITFVRVVGQQSDEIQHRWLYGTISGDTITGEFSDIANPQGTGTFTLIRS